MSINITENTLVIWRVQLTDKSDFLASLWKEPDGVVAFACRFRYYKDDKIGPDSEDDKSWYSGKTNPNADREKVIADFRTIVHKMAAAAADNGYLEAEVDEIVMDHRGVQGIIEEMGKRPWAHIQHVGES